MSAQIKALLRGEVCRCVEEQGLAPGLAIVRVGNDAAWGVYSKVILHAAEEIGIRARLEHVPAQTRADEVQALLVRLNQDRAVHGILVQILLPSHIFHTMVAATIAPCKDIDGISPHNAGNLLLGLSTFLPSATAAVMEMLSERTHRLKEGAWWSSVVAPWWESRWCCCCCRNTRPC